MKASSSHRKRLGWRNAAGLWAVAALSSLSFACIAQTGSGEAEENGALGSTESSEGRESVALNGKVGVAGVYGSGPSSASGSTGTNGTNDKGPTLTNPAGNPIPSPWQPNPIPGASNDPNEGNGPGGTVQSPVPSPWMNPPSGGETADNATNSESEQAAPPPSKTHTE